MSENAPKRGPRAVVPERIISDKSLAHRISGGDSSALDELFRRYSQPIYGFCSAMVGPEDAKDVLQNVMTKVMTSMPDSNDFEIKPWLYRVARNECIDLHRSSSKMSAGLEPDTRPDDSVRSDPHRALIEKDRINTLVEDLGQLPERQRSGLVMRELSGLSFAEIATTMGTSSDAAKQLVYEARLSLEQADLGRRLDCSEVREAISSLDRRRLKGKKVRAHLRSCRGCSDFEGAIKSRQAGFRSLFPGMPVPVAAGILASIKEGVSSTVVTGGTASVSGAVATGGTGLAAKALVAMALVGGVTVGARDLVRTEDSGTGIGKSAPQGPNQSRVGTVVPGVFSIPRENAAEVESRGNDADEKAEESERRLGADGRDTRTFDESGPNQSPETPTVPTEQGERITPGQGGGQGPRELPAPSASGQQRAEVASSAKPGQTGNPPPGLGNGSSGGRPDLAGPPQSAGAPPVTVPVRPEPKPANPSKPSK